MKLLIDNPLSPELVKKLNEESIEAVHVRDVLLHKSPDIEIFEYAKSKDFVIVTADTDFATILFTRRESKPSVIIFRGGTPRKKDLQFELLISNLSFLEVDLNLGAVVIFDESRIRIRNTHRED